MKTYFKLVITETACDCPKDSENTRFFNEEVKNFDSEKDILDFLIERYGKFEPSKLRKTYIDGIGENDAKQAGYLKSFWNKDWSHNSKNWYQTDWINIYKIESESFTF